MLQHPTTEKSRFWWQSIPPTFSTGAIRDIFAPFSAFQWTPLPPAPPVINTQAPLGADKKEAEKVAWLVTCAPYVTESQFVDAAKGLQFATHLQRDGVVASRIYKRLSGSTNELVSIKDVEKELKCKWGEIDVQLDGQPRRIDPYFWKLVEADIRKSCLEYIRTLDNSVTMLAGVHPMQRSTQIQQAMERLIRSVSHELANNLLRRDTDQSATVHLLQQLQTHYATEHVNFVKAHLQCNIQGYVALSRCAAASSSEFDEILQEGDQHITRLVVCPPNEFVEHLASCGAHISELSSTFFTNTNGLVSVSNAPPASFGVRATVLARWLHKHRRIVGEACAAQIGVCRRACALPPTHPTWTNIELCRSSPDDVRTREAMDACILDTRIVRGVTWTPPFHLGEIDEARILICGTPDCQLAVRACRVMEVLLQQAKLGLLPAMTVRASVILPVISRFTVENDFCYNAQVETRLRPIGKIAQVPWPDDVQCDYSQCGSNCNAPTYNSNKRSAFSSPPSSYASESEDETNENKMAREEPPASSVPLAPPANSSVGQLYSIANSAVPLAMQRDYAVLNSLFGMVRARKVASGIRVGLDEICNSVRTQSSYLCNTSESSLKQVVAHVAKRVVERAALQCPGGSVEYSGRRDRSADSRVDGIICDGPGSLALLAYLNYCLHKMCFDGVRFAREWPVSRSAASHARSAARKSGDKKTKF
tara:strand:- start:9416 stop:11539 length:2124 start_codon:yes stop_codon:yes gene_type:complete